MSVLKFLFGNTNLRSVTEDAASSTEVNATDQERIVEPALQGGSKENGRENPPASPLSDLYKKYAEIERMKEEAQVTESLLGEDATATVLQVDSLIQAQQIPWQDSNGRPHIVQFRAEDDTGSIVYLNVVNQGESGVDYLLDKEAMKAQTEGQGIDQNDKPKIAVPFYKGNVSISEFGVEGEEPNYNDYRGKVEYACRKDKREATELAHRQHVTIDFMAPNARSTSDKASLFYGFEIGNSQRTLHIKEGSSGKTDFFAEAKRRASLLERAQPVGILDAKTMHVQPLPHPPVPLGK